MNSKHHNTGACALLALGIASVFSITSAQAALVVSNLAEARAGTTNIASSQAVRFTTGDSPGWTLNSITVGATRSVDEPNEFVTVGIRQDVNGFPGATSLAFSLKKFSFTGTLDLTYENVTSTQGDPVTLAPNTNYWLIFSGSENPASTTSWDYTDSADQTGLAGWDIGSTRLNESAPNSGWNLSGSGSAYKFSITATAVPEPSAVALLGLSGLALLRRRR